MWVHDLFNFLHLSNIGWFLFFIISGKIIMYTTVHKTVFEFLATIRRGVIGSKGMDFLKRWKKMA